MFLMFGIFIFGCGTTHLMEVWTVWHGTYRLAGVIKAITARLPWPRRRCLCTFYRKP